jgi:hypothetical protein
MIGRVLMIVGMIMTVVMMAGPRVRRVRVPVARTLRRHFLRIQPFNRPTADQNTEPSTNDSAPNRLTTLDTDLRQTEAVNRIAHHFEWHAEIEAGTQKHISRDPARAIEVVNGHAAGRLPRRFLAQRHPASCAAEDEVIDEVDSQELARGGHAAGKKNVLRTRARIAARVSVEQHDAARVPEKAFLEDLPWLDGSTVDRSSKHLALPHQAMPAVKEKGTHDFLIAALVPHGEEPRHFRRSSQGLSFRERLAPREATSYFDGRENAGRFSAADSPATESTCGDRQESAETAAIPQQVSRKTQN